MRKYKCLINYDGTRFYGFQIQPYKRTVQGEIEKALKRMHKQENIRIFGSGRTDAGVHANGQVIHFETRLTLPEKQWKKALNMLLPADIYIEEVNTVSHAFHARFSAKEKVYKYYILNDARRDVFKQSYYYQMNNTLDYHAIERACQQFIGTHDFTSFSSRKASVKGHKVRTLFEVTCTNIGSEIIFTLRGNGFLYHMVRIIVGALLDVGKGVLAPEDIEYLLHKQDRTYVGKTLPPQGLYLDKVIYD